MVGGTTGWAASVNAGGGQAAPASAGGPGLSEGLAIGSVASSVIGAYYGAQAARANAREYAAALEHQQQLAFINARRAERAAQGSWRAGQRSAARAGLRYGQLKASAKAHISARGIVTNTGSAAEVLTSIDYAKEVDMITITRNAVAEASAIRAGRVNSENRARALGASAIGARAQAAAINPGFSATVSLIGGAGKVAKTYDSLGRTR